MHVVGQCKLAVGIRFKRACGRIHRIRHPIGLGTDRIRSGREGEETQPAVATIGAALVILKHAMHCATLEGVTALPFASHMAAKHEEEVRVILQIVIDGLALRAEARWVARVNNPVTRHDGTAIRESLHHRVRPVQNDLIARDGPRIVFEMQNNEIQPAGAEELIIIIVVR